MKNRRANKSENGHEIREISPKGDGEYAGKDL